MSHENVTFNANGTLSANPKHTLVWVPELSEGRREDDLVIMPNIALLVSKNATDTDTDTERISVQKSASLNCAIVQEVATHF